MTDIIDLNVQRNARDCPDAEFVQKDDYGRELYLFTLDYSMAGKSWAAEIWAYSFEDAEARVAAMRDSLSVAGQIYSVIPA